MALTVKDIIDKNLFEGMKLVAGKECINNPITGINVMEILDSPDTTSKGEILITTGYDLDDYERQKNLIFRLKSRGVAAMAVQSGYYIDHIPEFIIESANQYQFPILDLPSKHTFSIILQTLIYELSKDIQNISQSYLDYDYFYSVLHPKLQKNPEMCQSEKHKAFLFCITATNAHMISEEQLLKALGEIRSYLVSQADDSIFDLRSNGQGAFILQFKDEHQARRVAYDLLIKLTFISEQKGINFYVGSDIIPSCNELHQAFKHVLKCISLLGTIEAKRGVCPYSNYTFIKMFGFLYQNNHSFVLENQALQILLAKDRTSHTNYVYTIRIYLSENCNVTHTAERLFIHRHTLLNRIQAASDLCGIDFNDYYARIYMSMALLIHDYFAV